MNSVQTEPDLGLDPAEYEAWCASVALLAGDRYQVVRPLARGGMSIVLLGYDRREGRQVALKLLEPTQGSAVENRERFRREALISAQLDHPNIVPCYEFLYQNRLALAVMRYVPGHSLADRLGDAGRLDVRSTLSFLIPLAGALACAHRNGVVHRDVKPANILIQDLDHRPFLTDFGIATLKTSDHSRSEVGKGFGTPAFMAPEQVLGRWDADYRGDIYSLGLVAYRALAGRLPFRGESAISLAAQRTAREAAPLRELAPDVPRRLAAIVDRCVARNPRRRHRSCDDLRDALVRVEESLDRKASPGAFARFFSRIRPMPAASQRLAESLPTPFPL